MNAVSTAGAQGGVAATLAGVLAAAPAVPIPMQSGFLNMISVLLGPENSQETIPVPEQFTGGANSPPAATPLQIARAVHQPWVHQPWVQRILAMNAASVIPDPNNTSPRASNSSDNLDLPASPRQIAATPQQIAQALIQSMLSAHAASAVASDPRKIKPRNPDGKQSQASKAGAQPPVPAEPVPVPALPLPTAIAPSPAGNLIPAKSGDLIPLPASA
ncbi:MAG: hypothetical protein ACRD5L_02950, partial [Bryobacteraceae bacterium]